MADHNLREIASRCEAKLHALRRTAEGAVISFVIHPNEIPRALMLDPLGTRYMLAFVAIADDETPIPASHRDDGERPLSVTRPVQQGVIHTYDEAVRAVRSSLKPDLDSSVLDGGTKIPAQPGCGPKVPRQWYDMPPSQRAGIICGEKRFWIWLKNFRGTSVADEDEATNWLYQECGINSRAELKLDTNASPDVQAFQREQLRVFYAVESEYRKWAGMEREVR